MIIALTADFEILFWFRMANCRKCIILSTLCLTHHWALGATVETLTANVNNDIELDINCPMLRPTDGTKRNEPINVRFYEHEDLFPTWMYNGEYNDTVLSGPVDVDQLNVSVSDRWLIEKLWDPNLVGIIFYFLF